MKNVLTAVIAMLSFSLFSCQKEVDDILKTTGGNGSTSGLLKRTVIKQGSDSSTTDYFYNNAGKIIGVNQTTVSTGSFEFNNETIERNSQGFIERIITKASQLSQNGVDSLVATVTSSSGQYKSRIVQFSVLGTTVSFSSFYYYDGTGKIVSEKDYTDDGAGNVDSSQIDYSYTGTNLISLKGYDLSSASTTPDLTQVFEYDSKPSPLVVGNEGFVLNNFYQWFSANNLKKMTVNVSGDPDTHVETWDYNYNSASKPLLADITQDGQSGILMSYYYY
jgi:hypothetical protein